MSTPVRFRWNGEQMELASQNWQRLADKQFVIGELYDLVEHHQRSGASHRHYFHEIRDAWLNLPEWMTERFVTEEHLRKWALIKAGYCDERSLVCASRAEALKVASFVKPIDDYAVVLVDGNVVREFTAKSQSTKSMDRKTFQESKEAVLQIVSLLINTTPTELQRNAETVL